jgi:hypothetical protein
MRPANSFKGINVAKSSYTADGTMLAPKGSSSNREEPAIFTQ